MRGNFGDNPGMDRIGGLGPIGMQELNIEDLRRRGIPPGWIKKIMAIGENNGSGMPWPSNSNKVQGIRQADGTPMTEDEQKMLENQKRYSNLSSDLDSGKIKRNQFNHRVYKLGINPAMYDMMLKLRNGMKNDIRMGDVNNGDMKLTLPDEDEQAGIPDNEFNEIAGVMGRKPEAQERIGSRKRKRMQPKNNQNAI